MPRAGLGLCALYLHASAIRTGRCRRGGCAIRIGLALHAHPSLGIATRQCRRRAIGIGLTLNAPRHYTTTTAGIIGAANGSGSRAVRIGHANYAVVVFGITKELIVCIRSAVRVRNALATGTGRRVTYWASRRVRAVGIRMTEWVAGVVSAAGALAIAVRVYQAHNASAVLRVAGRRRAVTIAA